MGTAALGENSSFGKAEDPSSSRVLEEIGRDLYQSTDPIRSNLIDRSMQFLEGGYDPTSSPMYGALKRATETQFDNARDRVIRSTAPGGDLTSGLVDLETGRAGALTSGIASLYQDEMGRALSLGTGSPLSQSTGSMTSAGAIQSQIALANAQVQAAGKEGLGRAIGSSTTGGK